MDESKQPFLDHLQELSRRIKYSLLGVVVGVVFCFIYADPIYDFLARPLIHAFRETPKMHFVSPMEPFFVNMKIGLVGGFVLAAPLIFFQLWFFIAPGLYRRERRLVIPFVFFATLFFFGGICFAYYVVFPFGFEYLLGFAYEREGNFSVLEAMAKVFDKAVDYKAANFASAQVVPTIMIDTYINLVMKLLLAFGLIFELPLVIYFLARVGLVTHRGLWRFFRYWIVISFLLAAALTPPDVITQALMAGPLIVMYLGSTVVAWIVTRRREKREAAGYYDEPEA